MQNKKINDREEKNNRVQILTDQESHEQMGISHSEANIYSKEDSHEEVEEKKQTRC